MDKSTKEATMMRKILFFILFTRSSTSFATDLSLCLGCHNEQNTMNKTNTIVSTGHLRNFLHGQPLIDWLNRFGASCLSLVMPSVTSVTFSLSR